VASSDKDAATFFSPRRQKRPLETTLQMGDPLSESIRQSRAPKTSRAENSRASPKRRQTKARVALAIEDRWRKQGTEAFLTAEGFPVGVRNAELVLADAPQTNGTAVKVLEEDHGATPVRRFTAGGQQYNFTYTVSDTSKPIRIAMVFTDAPGAVGSGSFPAVNYLSMGITAPGGGSLKWCDTNAIDADGYTIPSSNCFFPDLDNNVHYVTIRPGSFSGQFTSM
jgi:hypothetical protein